MTETTQQRIERIAGEQSKVWSNSDFLKRQIIAALTAFAEEQQKDTERLNWLISRSAYLSHSRDGDVCNVWYSHDPDDDSNGAVPVEGYPQKCYHDAREAIDAAMRFTLNRREA